MTDPPRLGSFQLTGPLGAGGMGTVWAAVHEPTGRLSAVKVLSPEHSRSVKLRGAFRTEVRAAASLDHPHVIALYDHGVVEQAAVDRSEGRLARGAPWLAMEHAEGGDMARFCGRLDVSEVLGTLRALLDALAHAHARRVLHRDLKPGNIVVGGVRPGIKLTDFGLADLDAGDRPGGGGTPAYMAPEQLSHRWRTFGPWTDLFALGCVGWSLLTGEPPFGHEIADVVRRHGEPLPSLGDEALRDLERWLHVLLHTDPRRRYPSAPEAARALARLTVSLPVGLDVLEGPTLEVPTAQALPTLDWFVSEPTGAAAPGTGSGPTSGEVRRRAGVPVPLSWRSVAERVRRTLLPGAGLSLLRLRPPPLIGREAEREQLWGALREVVRRKRVGVVVLSGEAGSGKSRLARWLCERSHELAASSALQAGHSPTGGPADGLPALLRRHLRAEGLGGPALRAHLMGRLAGADAELVASLAGLLDPEHDHGVSLGDETERHRVVLDALQRIAQGGSCVVWLDDAHWGPETLRWARAALRQQEDLRLLVVLTVRDDLIAELPRSIAALAELQEAGAVRVPVGPLDNAVQLVRDGLGLEGDLASRIADSTGGVPLFAVQLVEDWLDRGLLAPGSRGFRLATDDTLSLPPTLDGVWLARIDRVLTDQPGDAGLAVERAAILGTRVGMDEWALACADLDVEVAALGDALADQGLSVALDGRDGFRWVHGMLRESLVARADHEGHAAAHHAACADAVAAGTAGDREARLGRHLLAAGQAEAAIEPLLAGAEANISVGNYGQAAALVQSWERAMGEARVPPEDRRWPRGFLLRAQGASMVDEASEELIERALKSARLGQHRREEGMALYLWAVRIVDLGLLEQAEHEAREADALADDWPELRVKLRALQATVARTRGDLIGAQRWLDQALELLDETDGRQAGNLHVQIGLLADALGDYDRGDAAFDSALLAFRSRGVRRGIAHALNGKAEVARHRGEPERAAGLYQEALRIYQIIGGAESLYVRANLAMLEIDRSAFGNAAAVLGPAIAEAEATGQGWLLVVIHVMLGAAVAGTGSFQSALRHVRIAKGLLGTSGVVDQDLARALEITTELASAAGKRDLAELSAELAAAQRAALARN